MFTRVKNDFQLQDVLSTLSAICDRAKFESKPFPNFVVTCLLYSIRFYLKRKDFYDAFLVMVTNGYNPLHLGVTDVEKTMYQHIKHIVLNYEKNK